MEGGATDDFGMKLGRDFVVENWYWEAGNVIELAVQLSLSFGTVETS